jgi:hypothetical protein
MSSRHLFLFSVFVLAQWLPSCSSQGAAESTSPQTCVTESASLNTNSEVSSAVGAFQDEALSSMQDFVSTCNVLSHKCYKNLTTLSSAEELISVCVAQGGKVVNQDVRLKCEGSVDGVQIPGGFSIVADDFPTCVGTSCDPENLPTEVTSVSTVLSLQAKKEITIALGDEITCKDSAGFQNLFSTTLLVWSFFVLPWICFYCF